MEIVSGSVYHCMNIDYFEITVISVSLECVCFFFHSITHLELHLYVRILF